MAELWERRAKPEGDAHGSLFNRVSDLEREVHGCRGELGSLRSQLRSVQDMVLTPKHERDLGAQLRDLEASLARERAIREEQMRLCEEGVRSLAEGPAPQQEALRERLDALQRAVGVVDDLVRREAEERALESRRIWHALREHTHDIDLSSLGVPPEQLAAAAGAGAAGAGAPLPAQPLQVQRILPSTLVTEACGAAPPYYARLEPGRVAGYVASPREPTAYGQFS